MLNKYFTSHENFIVSTCEKIYNSNRIENNQCLLYSALLFKFGSIISVPILLIAKLLCIETYIIEDLVFPWIGFLLLGYIQWFIFIPKLKI